MTKDSKIYIAGHRGFAGSAIMRLLQQGGYTHLITNTRSELDLIDQNAVNDFFEREKPEYVFLAAARVGGIMANISAPAEFMYENLQIQNNVIHAAYTHHVTKLLFLGTSCVYPRECPQPMKEEYLLTGIPEPTNEAYALAKIAGLKMCQYYYTQYGVNFIACMPPNLYGPGDSFDPEHSHVMAALIRKFHEATTNNSPNITLWGTGSARREHLYIDDMASACLFLMENFNPTNKENSENGIFLNTGSGIDASITELAELIRNITGYTGEIKWDTAKPDGMPQKLLDVSRVKAIGWEAKIPLEEGVKKTYQWYVNSLEKQ